MLWYVGVPIAATYSYYEEGKNLGGVTTELSYK